MKQSAGILLCKQFDDGVKVLLVHPAGPLWAHKDSWQIPKGEVDDNEELIDAAKREFEEEIGIIVPQGEWFELGSAKTSSKMNHIWLLIPKGEVDLSDFHSNTFTMEWPPKSGKMQEFPECDKAEWFDLKAAKQKLFKSQIIFIDRLAELLGLGAIEPNQPSLF